MSERMRLIEQAKVKLQDALPYISSHIPHCEITAAIELLREAMKPVKKKEPPKPIDGARVTALDIRHYGSCKRCRAWKLLCGHAALALGVSVMRSGGDWIWKVKQYHRTAHEAPAPQPKE